jgi:hypothetical protein
VHLAADPVLTTHRPFYAARNRLSNSFGLSSQSSFVSGLTLWATDTPDLDAGVLDDYPGPAQIAISRVTDEPAPEATLLSSGRLPSVVMTDVLSDENLERGLALIL